MGKFTYTIDQETIHERYEQHILTTTNILELTKIDKQIDENCLKNTLLLFLIIFVTSEAQRIFDLKKLAPRKYVLVDDLQSLRDLFVTQPHLYDSLAAVGAPAEGECF